MITFKPPAGTKGSWLQAKRECLALLTFLDDPVSFAGYLREYGADAVLGIAGAEPASANVLLTAELSDDGELVLTSEEQPGIEVV